MAIKTVDEYLYELKPYISTSLWDKANNKIESFVQKAQTRFDRYTEISSKKLETASDLNTLLSNIKQQEQLAKNLYDTGDMSAYNKKLELINSDKLKANVLEGRLKDLESAEKKLLGNKTSEQLMKSAQIQTKIFGTVTKVASGVSKVISVLNTSLEISKKITESATLSSNKFISNDSMFVDSRIRDLMGKFGLNPVQAQGLNTAMELLNIDESDFGRLPEAQKKLLDKLKQQYEDAIAEIDPDKLERFNKVTQEYQALQASLSIRLQTLWTKLLAESPQYEKLIDNLSSYLDKLMSFLESPAVQWGFDTLLSILNGFLDVLNALGSVSLPIFGATGNTNNYKTTSTTTNKNTFYISGSSSEQTARKVSNALQSGSVLNG